MRHAPAHTPSSSLGRLRRIGDLVAGRYPKFLFGFDVGTTLPLFEMPPVSEAAWEPILTFLAENHYYSVPAKTVAAVARGEKPARRAVALLTGAASSELWRIGYPLLRQYGLRAIAYAIPGRTIDARGPRPSVGDEGSGVPAEPGHDSPLATWPELKGMVASGWIDVQSHTWSHARIFAGTRPIDVVRAETPDALLCPRVNATDPPLFVDGTRLGYPLYRTASRMSDKRRFLPDEDATARLEAFVAERGGRAFFSRPRWLAEIRPLLRAIGGRLETGDERRGAIEHELAAARESLEQRLGTTVRHVSMPWGVAGQVAGELLRGLGMETAIVSRRQGAYGVSGTSEPLALKPLPSAAVFSLPGVGRRFFSLG